MHIDQVLAVVPESSPAIRWLGGRWLGGRWLGGIEFGLECSQVG
ncbi:hypothetical protein [Xylella taiwanensis]|nr:hypothetical protein [Xylella taiwanensis]